MRHQPHSLNKSERGAALLATTLAIIVILLTMGVSMVSTGMFEGFIAQTQGNAAEAFNGAQSGAQDAQLRIARDKNFTSAGYLIPSGCTLNGTVLCTRVIVEKDTASVCSQSISTGQDCVIATGTFSDTTRKLEVILSVDSTNGKISQVSWKEL